MGFESSIESEEGEIIVENENATARTRLFGLSEEQLDEVREIVNKELGERILSLYCAFHSER